jgi:hypothetical protein
MSSETVALDKEVLLDVMVEVSRLEAQADELSVRLIRGQVLINEEAAQGRDATKLKSFWQNLNQEYQRVVAQITELAESIGCENATELETTWEANKNYFALPEYLSDGRPEPKIITRGVARDYENDPAPSRLNPDRTAKTAQQMLKDADIFLYNLKGRHSQLLELLDRGLWLVAQAVKNNQFVEIKQLVADWRANLAAYEKCDKRKAVCAAFARATYQEILSYSPPTRPNTENGQAIGDTAKPVARLGVGGYACAREQAS